VKASVCFLGSCKLALFTGYSFKVSFLHIITVVEDFGGLESVLCKQIGVPDCEAPSVLQLYFLGA